MINADPSFEQRKRDHIQIALSSSSQSSRSAGFENIQLIHEALPEFNFQDVSLAGELLGHPVSAPFFISSMTAGHHEGRSINRVLAQLSEKKQILMGVGSQRRELFDPASSEEWVDLRREFPRAFLAANLGIAQVIQAPSSQVASLVNSLQAAALFVHLNPLQECLQTEGTPQFAGASKALQRLVKDLGLPIVVKETGSGMSISIMRRLADLGIHAIDISGVGGTHWGQVEELRKSQVDPSVVSPFENWGMTTVQGLQAAQEAAPSLGVPVWASGGVRHGVDVAKAMALGAQAVGLARPWLQAAVATEAEQSVEQLYERLCTEFKVALFCTGCISPGELHKSKRWISWK